MRMIERVVGRFHQDVDESGGDGNGTFANTIRNNGIELNNLLLALQPNILSPL